MHDLSTSSGEVEDCNQLKRSPCVKRVGRRTMVSDTKTCLICPFCRNMADPLCMEVYTVHSRVKKTHLIYTFLPIDPTKSFSLNDPFLKRKKHEQIINFCKHQCIILKSKNIRIEMFFYYEDGYEQLADILPLQGNSPSTCF